MHLDLSHLTNFERDLSDYLRPVDPDPGFIDKLSQRLNRSDRTIMDYRPRRQVLPIIVIGLVIGLIILVLSGSRSKK